MTKIFSFRSEVRLKKVLTERGSDVIKAALPAAYCKIVLAMDYLKRIVNAIELHDIDGIRECFRNGISPNEVFNGKPLIDELTSEYARTPRFKECIKEFVSYGLVFRDSSLLAVLLDDADVLQKHLKTDHGLLTRKYSLRCAYTPLQDVSLLHICAEFDHLQCAKVLVSAGIDVNARAGVDGYGFGGQTAIFHTVNQNSNNSIDVLRFLLLQSPDLAITVKGIVWGKGYEWETLIPSVNPISYAMMGLIPQMHRNEVVISEVVSMLLESAYGIRYQFSNVPCQYLQ
jgi:hypothetical protein